MDFLAIETSKMPDKNYEMNLIFSGDIVIKLVAEAIEVMGGRAQAASEGRQDYGFSVAGVSYERAVELPSVRAVPGFPVGALGDHFAPRLGTLGRPRIARNVIYIRFGESFWKMHN